MKWCILILVFLVRVNGLCQQNVSTLSWNIKMLPAICETFSRNITEVSDNQRLDSIIAYINKSDIELIQLQEVFDKKAAKKIANSLKENYPYVVFPVSQGLKFSNGLMVLSKYPIEFKKKIFFKNSKLQDFFVSKGAILYQALIKGEVFFFINTHLQSDYKLITSEKLRLNQLSQINQELLSEEYLANRPLLLMGDFNFNENSNEYKEIRNTFSWRDLSLDSKSLITFNPLNSWNKNILPEKLDYIFIKDPNSIVQNPSCQMIQDAKIRHIDLSDHYALKMLFYINNPFATLVKEEIKN